MTPSQINAAMAELDGWDENVESIDYTTDLNAVARVEARLTDDQIADYQAKLWEITEPADGCMANWIRSHLLATAAQRCESILRAVGEWGE